MSRNAYLPLSLIGLGVALIVAIYLADRSASPNVMQIVSPSPDVQATESYQSTVAAERTAIAIFTQNPTLALSSTPFYAEIIYNEVARNLTEIPLPVRNYYITAVPSSEALSSSESMQTPTPSRPIPTASANNPVRECRPTLSTVTLSDLSREVIELHAQRGIEIASIGFVSFGVEGIDRACTIPFQAVLSRVSLYVNVESGNDTAQLANLTTEALDFLIGYWDEMEYVSKKAVIRIFFQSQDGTKSLNTTYDAVVQALADGLQGEALVQALGGFTDEN